MDFIHDRLTNGQAFRVLAIIDVCTRECRSLVPLKRFQAHDVVRALSHAIDAGSAPRSIRCDNGTEFTSIALDQWAHQATVELDFSRPGRPTDNAFVESFNARFREECLNQHWFDTIEDASRHLSRWKKYYNNKRLHSALGNLAPSEYALTICQHKIEAECREISH